MSEGYEIRYHPVGDEDPNDEHSEAHQDGFYMQATGRTGWPGAIDEPYLLETNHRAHLIVTEGNHTVVRILRAPLKEDFPTEVWQDAMTQVMMEIGKRYPLPKYNMAFGGSCLQDAMRSFPLATNYHQVPIEQIILTPKQTSTPRVPG